MTIWPEATALRACIAWNEDERRRALADAKSGEPPSTLTKIVDNKKVPVPTDEYRAMRAKDATRFASNIKAVKERL